MIELGLISSKGTVSFGSIISSTLIAKIYINVTHVEFPSTHNHVFNLHMHSCVYMHLIARINN